MKSNNVSSAPRRPRKPTKYDLQLWNSLNPVGSPCELTDDFGKKRLTRTRSVAWELGHGEAVVMVDGITGGYMLDRIRILESHTDASEQRGAEKLSTS